MGVEVMRRVIDDTALQLPKVAGQYPVLPNNSSDYLANPRLSLLILYNCTSSGICTGYRLQGLQQ